MGETEAYGDLKDWQLDVLRPEIRDIARVRQTVLGSPVKENKLQINNQTNEKIKYDF